MSLSDFQTYIDNQATWLAGMQNLLTNIDANITESLGRLENLEEREYGYTHDEIVTDDLESDYQAIITANPSLAFVSAVGILAILKAGEYVAVTAQPDDWSTNYRDYFYSTQSGYSFNTSSTWDSNKTYYKYTGNAVSAEDNRLFINRSEESDYYTFRGTNSQNGLEIVKIWFFEKNDITLTLAREPDFYGYNALIIKEKSLTPSINARYINVTNYTTEDYLNTVNNQPFKRLNLITNNQTVPQNYKISAACEFLYCNATKLGDTSTPYATFTNISSLKRLKFPFLKTLTGQHSSSKGFTNNPNLSVYKEDIPALETTGTSNGGTSALYFYNSKLLELPETVKEIGTGLCSGITTVRLFCKNATSIHDAWYTSASVSPTNFYMCSDWGASINIATAAANWVMADYIDLLNNKLRDMSEVEGTHSLKVPSAMLTALQADEDGTAALTAATTKGWTISS